METEIFNKSSSTVKMNDSFLKGKIRGYNGKGKTKKEKIKDYNGYAQTKLKYIIY